MFLVGQTLAFTQYFSIAILKTCDNKHILVIFFCFEKPRQNGAREKIEDFNPILNLSTKLKFMKYIKKILFINSINT